jgi:hypothetical protein
MAGLRSNARVLPRPNLQGSCYYKHSMAPTKEMILKSFGYIIADLQWLLRSHQAFTESEQLFFKKRLTMLQMEYYRWAQQPIDIECRSKKFSVDLKKAS